MRPLILSLLLVPACATAPTRIRYAPPEPLACARATALAAVQLAAGPCAPPAPDALMCSLATVAAVVGLVECQPVPVMVSEPEAVTVQTQGQ